MPKYYIILLSLVVTGIGLAAVSNARENAQSVSDSPLLSLFDSFVNLLYTLVPWIVAILGTFILFVAIAKKVNA